MPKRPLVPPFGGRSDGDALYAQSGLTTKSAANVRGRDPTNGRIRISQRAGMIKHCDTVLGAGKVKALCSTTIDDRKVTYSFTAGQEDEVWSRATPSKSGTVGGVTDRQGNVYAIDGNAGVAKFNSAGRLLMKIALPVDDKSHVVRALFVDEGDRIFAGVSAGGDVTTAKVFCVLQRPSPGQPNPDDANQYFVLWSITPGAYTEALKVYRGSQLFCAHNYQTENRSRVVVYEGLGLEPVEVKRIESVAYPIHDFDVLEDGAVYCATAEGVDYGGDGFLRQGFPGQPRIHANIEGWTIFDLEDVRKRLWAYYDADETDETDLDQSANDVAAIAEGQRVLRWRDLSGNGRHFYAHTITGQTGPTLRLRGLAGLKSIYFDQGNASALQSMITLPNASMEKSTASQQRTAIPSYIGSMWAMFILIRPTQETNGGTPDPRVVFYADNQHATASNHGLWVNRACGGTEPGTFSSGDVSYFATTDAADDGDCAAADQAADFDYTSEAQETGCTLITILWDGDIDGGNTAKTRCLFRVNGRPIDRFEGLPYQSLLANYLGYAPTVGATQARQYNGEIMAMAVLDRINRFDDSTEPKVMTHDQLERGDTSAHQTDTEVCRIEAWMLYRRGLASLLEERKDAGALPPNRYGHFYSLDVLTGFFRGPPAPTTGGLSTAYAQIIHTYPLLSKHDPQGTLQWVCNESTHPDTGSNRGGIGWGVRARKVESDGLVHVWSAGPDAAEGVGGDVALRKIIDIGTSFNGTQAEGAWRNKFSGNQAIEYQFPRMASDKFGNIHFPMFAAGFGRTYYVFEKDPDGSGNAVQVVEFILPAPADRAYAVALPPDALTPDYRTDLPEGPAELAYLFTPAGDGLLDPADSVFKILLVATDADASGSPRTVVTIGVSGSDIKTVTSAAVAIPSGGSGAVDATSQYVDAFQADREIVVLDGLGYKVYSPLTGLVTTLEATSAGEIPPRGKIGCMWRHRLVIGRFADKPGRYCASATGNIRDWDFRREPRLATMAFDASLTRAGEVEDSIESLIPLSDDLLLVMGSSRILRLTGDPQGGGQIDKMSDDLGGSFGRSWCKDQSGRAFFWGNPPGLYMTDGSSIVPLTRDTIEDTDFKDIDYATHRIELAWDPIQKGVVISRIGHAAAVETVDNWFWEEKTHRLVQGGAIWPDSYAVVGKQPSAFAYLAGDSTRGLLVGCEDGFVRIIDADAADDDGSAIDSFVVIGPINETGEMIEHRLISTQVTLADGQQGARLEIFASEEADNIGPIRASSDLSPGLNDPFRGRVRGNYIWVRLRSALVGRRWAMERGEAEIVAVSTQKNRST